MDVGHFSNNVKEKYQMKTTTKWSSLFLLLFVLITLLIIDGNGLSYAKNPEMSEVVFYVQ